MNSIESMTTYEDKHNEIDKIYKKISFQINNSMNKLKSHITNTNRMDGNKKINMHITQQKLRSETKKDII